MLSAPKVSSSITLEEVKSQIYSRNNPTLTPIDIEMHASTVHRILELKRKHNVFMLGHNYMEPLVFGLSTEKEQGDSLALSMQAVQTDSNILIFNGVRFMAETAKVLNPNKTILIADKNHRSRGYGKMSLKKIIKFSRDRLNINNFYCNIYDYNIQSINCFKSVGFTEISKNSVDKSLIQLQCN